MIKRAAIWTLVGLWATAVVPGIVTNAFGVDVGGGAATQPAPDTATDTATPPPTQVPPDQPTTEAPGDDGAGTDEQPVAPVDEQPEPSLFQQLFLPLLLVGFVVLWIFGSRKSRSSEKKRQEMLSNIKKGDKVTSIGGIVGTIIEVRDAEITVKVDESSNARMKFARWAIRSTGTPSDQQTDQTKS